MEQLCQELDVPYMRSGALVIATDESEKEKLDQLYKQGIQNGVQELRILDSVQLREMEPNISESTCAALFAPTAAIVCPFTLTIAMAENAAANGVEFFFEKEVTSIEHSTAGYRVCTKQKECYEGRVIINCAGVYSDVLHNMVSEKKYHITPRRGQYCLLDKEAGGHVNHTIFKVPGPLGKGILVTQTVHGNLLLGPTAENIDDRDGVNTTREGLDQVLQGTGTTVRNIPTRQVITSFSGLRAHEDGGDFIIEEAADAPGFIDAVGIESPGLSSAPAIGTRLCELAVKALTLQSGSDHGLEKNPNYSGYRQGILNFLSLSEKEQTKLLKVRPEYGTIVCRCEMITEGEILDAIYRPVGARSLDGIKRRTRAGMGRCQSGFCSPRVVEILSEALHTDPVNITRAGTGAEILTGRTKEQTDGTEEQNSRTEEQTGVGR